MTMRRLFTLALLLSLLTTAGATATTPYRTIAAPLTGPCVPGAAYDPACDANQDGHITITDIQLAAGHWNQNGAFVSDNNHTHLGQTWTGANNPLKIQGVFGAPDYAPLVLSNSAGHGLSIPTASIDGIYVGSAGAYGMVVNHSGQDGVYVGTAGTPSSNSASTEANGFEVAGAQGHGLFVGRADREGLHVNSAGYNGVYVDSTGYTGFTVYTAGTVGFNVHSAGSYGVYVGAAGYDGINAYGAAYAGNFVGDINVTGNCIGCLQANFGINAGDHALQPGDVVSVQSIASTDFDTGPALWQVTQAQPGQAVVGVVAGRAELVTEKEHRPMETGKRLVPRDGAAQPGEYVTIVYSGPMQVRTAPGDTAIAAGTRLTVGSDGHVRPLQTRTVEGMVVTEGAPVVGVALEAAKDGLVWVLVNPQ
ncbi:hypothetical protein [Candidatus Amarolinea aalborgensis]|jgi:hypothetical protein|uniref:hypothetical protein n=1 Tax=Candidatus Amarolinea aalborgensis TaxID=2249329 RepID=UPI003BFA05A6